MLQAASQRGRAAAAQNLHPHRLGSGGYKSAEPTWKEDEVIYSASSSSGISSADCPRGYRFLRSRAKKNEEGKLFVEGEATQAVHNRLVINSLSN